ncbi:MAG: hypothetical protein PHD01_13985, partial [Geobacteraceae bacterium]|nr:hypothetical protein [Geobacteraceae bacterium]
RQARVVIGRGGDAFTFDFAPIRGTAIHDDLAFRDFTINALALPVTRVAGSLLDPLHGLRDIAEGKIRACGTGIFDDDPLRLLRAIRFAVTLGFAIEEVTWQEMLTRSHLLANVAGERIREEFFLVLGARNVAASLELLRSSGLLPMIIPGDCHNGEYFSDFAARRTFAAGAERVIEDCERLFPSVRDNLSAHLERPVEGGISLFSLLKLAAFLSGEDARESIKTCCDRIRLGAKARAELKVLCDCATAFPSVPESVVGERFLYRFFRDRAPGGAELVVLPLAARLIDPEMATRLVSFYFYDYRPTDANLLLSGEQVMNLLGVGPGPRLGRILETLREAESVGQVSTVDEAREFLLKTVDNSRSIG